MKKTDLYLLHLFLLFTPFFLAGCLTPPPGEIPETRLLNEYLNREIARFYPEPPAVSPQTAEYIKADAQGGNPETQLQLGMLYLTGRGFKKDPAAAWTWFEKATLQGNDDAMVMQGSLLLYGKDIPSDKDAAIALYEKAAAKGNSRALFELGSVYYRGENKNREKAARYFEKAAQNGYTPAALALGIYYLSLDENDSGPYREKGRQLVTEAAEKGDLVAEYVLGVFYQEGRYFEQDHEKARLWYTRAAEKGSPQAIQELKEMGATPPQKESTP